MVKSKLNRHNRSWGCAAKLEGSTYIRDMQKESALYVTRGGFFEVTINLPRTVEFCSSVSNQQKMVYSRLWDGIKSTISVSSETDYVFEFCKTGHVHLHGIIKVPPSFKLIPIGGISDIVKRFCISYSNVYKNLRLRDVIKYNEKCIYYMDNIYKSPAICVRYRSDKEKERMTEWESYMHKCYLKI